MTLGTALLLVALGLGVGVFGTLVGAGGGFILTPVLLLLYPHDSATTITSISLVVVFFNALSGSLAYAHQRRIDYRSGAVFAAATVPGAVVGALLVGAVPRLVFDALMTALLAGLAAWLLAGSRTVPGVGARAKPPVAGRLRTITARDGSAQSYRVPMLRGALLSLGVGFISSFLGIGGGVIHVPLLIGLLGFPVHVATATSHFVLANMAAVGTVTHIATGDFANGVGVRRSIALSIGVVAGAQLGALLSRRVRGPVIERLLALALGALAVRLLLTLV